MRAWLSWAAVGMEGVVSKRLDGAYEPSVRGWLKYKVRETTEAVVGAVTGPVAAPDSLLLGRYDDDGCLQYTGRTTNLSTGWGTRETLDVTLVRHERNGPGRRATG